jgi:hypothetical protein
VVYAEFAKSYMLHAQTSRSFTSGARARGMESARLANHL